MAVNAAYYFWIIIQVVIGYNLIQPLLLLAFYKLRRVFVSKDQYILPISPADYAVIVTAYQQTDLLPSVVASILEMDYPHFLVYVVADNCDISNLHFDDERVILLRPEETIASNTGSHFYAIRHFKRSHDRLTIVDSDNIVDRNYLSEIDKVFSSKTHAVQGIRMAKNLDTTYACLDAARDMYYHFYDGKILYGAGASATLSGSAMAFDTWLYRECLEHLDIRGAGFDKVLQHAIVKRGYRIAFTDGAILYDEKTSQSVQLVKQRSRWINTWFRYFTFGFDLVRRGVNRMNFNQFLFGTVLLRPPLFIFLVLSVLFMLINFWINVYMALVWLTGLLLFVAGFAIALLSSNAPRKIYRALAGIPQFMFFQIVSLLNARSANKISVATEHYHHQVKNQDHEGK